MMLGAFLLVVAAESATSTPFVGANVLRASHQLFLGGTSPPPHSLCTNMGLYTSDNYCDSPGSELPMCAYGADCVDCAPRMPRSPPQPPVSSPPRPPTSTPPAPAAPAALCINSVTRIGMPACASDGCCCNDGGPGAEYPDGQYGTDGADCGMRQPLPLLTASSPPGKGICLETCVCADCDDGGPSSELTMCAYGTNCVGFGPRQQLPPSPPRAPPWPPSPPKAPPATPSPSSLCPAACIGMHAYGSNSDDGGHPCDDGGAGTEFSDCQYGTDYADCAPRAQPPPLLLYKTSELRSGSTGKLVRYIGKRVRPTVEEAAHVVGDGSGVPWDAMEWLDFGNVLLWLSQHDGRQLAHATTAVGSGSIVGSVASASLVRSHQRELQTQVSSSSSLLALGGSHTCAYLTSSALLKCWGANFFGQLGDGTTTARATATTINVGGAVGLLALGSSHTCAYLTSSALLKCWGANSYGQLGDGTTTQRATPTTINVGGAVGLLALGSFHTCAYLTSSALLKCWGANYFSQLGDGTTTDRATATTINVGGAVGLLALGDYHTCAYLTNSALLKCWGRNGYGQLGDGTTTDRATPTTINVGGAVGLLALGGSHTCAYLTSGALLKCWGRNGYGQLCDGTTTQCLTPITINVGGAVGLLALGGSHTCAYLTSGALLKCWGWNGYGQLGDGTTTNRATLTTTNVWGAVGLLALGGSHTCAYLTNSTLLKCWGYNYYGQLGDNTTTTRVSPFFSPPALCGTLSEDTFLFAGRVYVLTCQVFVPSGIVLRVEQGVTIYASPVAAGGGGAPALIIEKGGSLLAEGSATAPI
eukprot:jgi/Chrpa1/3964/Chrysochromulina_OHIO_Genome00012863-RA